ncbi:MAG: alpha-L-rhamnosidase C-terminal domain-containing protein [Planctomycetota bacterium]
MRVSSQPRSRDRFAAFALAVLALAPGAPAACWAFEPPSSAASGGWQASWIGASAPDAPNTWLQFRKTLEIKKLPERAACRIACDSKYWLWVNDKLIVREGQLKRGPTPRDTYFDQVDLADSLRVGGNTFALLVQYFGRHGFSHNSSGAAGLVFELLGDDERLLTSDGSWRVRRAAEFGTTSPPLNNFRLPQANLRYDARLAPRGWQTAGFDDSAWEAAIERGSPPVAPWNQLYARPIPMWRDSGLRKYAVEPTPLLSSSGGRVECRLPYNCHASPYFKVRAAAGKVIRVSTDVRQRYGKRPTEESHRHEYVTRDGVQDFELPAWMNGHVVVYDFDPGVEVLELAYRETGYDADFVGSFECSDDRLNRLWKKAERTLYVTMRQSYMDCPDRERALWWGDAVNELGEAFYVFDATNGPLLARKCIYEVVRWQKPDGVLYSPIPAGTPPTDGGPGSRRDGTWYKELPPQMLATVGRYGIGTYYRYSGDADTVRDSYPAVKRYLGLWRFEDGLVVHRPGDWDWSDWGKNIDVPVLDNAWYAIALQGAIELASIVGAEQDIPLYQQRLAMIEENFNNAFWTGAEYRSPDYAGLTDDRANAMAVVARLAEPSAYPQIRAVLAEQQHASPYMEKYVLEALCLMGEEQQAINRMLTRYGPMIDQELTTLWEHFGRDGQGAGTYNHGWSGGPLTVLSQYIAGIAPSSPAFETFVVRPRLGGLERVASTVPTRFGDIVLEVVRPSASKAVATLTVPPGTQATVELGGSVVQLGPGRHEVVGHTDQQ